MRICQRKCGQNKQITGYMTRSCWQSWKPSKNGELSSSQWRTSSKSSRITRTSSTSRQYNICQNGKHVGPCFSANSIFRSHLGQGDCHQPRMPFREDTFLKEKTTQGTKPEISSYWLPKKMEAWWCPLEEPQGNLTTLRRLLKKSHSLSTGYEL